MNSLTRIIICIIAAILSQLLAVIVLGKLSSGFAVIAITITAMITQKYRKERNE